MTALSLELVQVEGVGAVLLAQGPFDAASAPLLAQALEGCARRGHGRVTIDCAAVPFMNDAALTVLEEHGEAMTKRGGGLTLAGVNDRDRVVLTMLGVTRKLAGVQTERVVHERDGVRLAIPRDEVEDRAEEVERHAFPDGTSLELIQVEGTGTVLVAQGPLDAASAPALDQALEGCARRGQHRVAIDCARVPVIQDAALGVLEKHGEAMTERGGGLTLAGVNDRNRVLLGMLGVARKLAEVKAERIVNGARAPIRLAIRPGKSERAGVAVLHVDGVIDDRTEKLELDAFPQAASRGLLDVIVDCAKLRALEGAGLEQVARYARALAELGGGVQLFSVSRELQRALEASGAAKAFVKVCSEERAPILA